MIRTLNSWILTNTISAKTPTVGQLIDELTKQAMRMDLTSRFRLIHPTTKGSEVWQSLEWPLIKKTLPWKCMSELTLNLYIRP